MSVLTVSEELFESLCSIKSLECIRIPVGKKKTADYEVALGPLKLIVEVKQLDPNEEDKVRGELGTRDCPVVTAPSNRVQRLISEGYSQVKTSCGGEKPTMIVVYNNFGDWNWIDAFTVSRAMFGSFGFEFGRSGETINVISHGYRGQRKLTQQRLRALSVIGVMKRKWPNEIHLDCYHNPFATIPVNPELLSRLATKHLIHSNPHANGFVMWEPKTIKT